MTTYALPLNGSVRHDHAHSQTHLRGLPQERFPRQHDASPTRKDISTNNLHSHLHSHPSPDRTQTHSELSNHQRFKLNAQLSAARGGANGHINGEVKGMEHHVNLDSVTVRPRGNSYGFPRVNKDTDHSPHSGVPPSTTGTPSRSVLLSPYHGVLQDLDNTRLMNLEDGQFPMSSSRLYLSRCLTSSFHLRTRIYQYCLSRMLRSQA